MNEIVTKKCPHCERVFETIYADKVYCDPVCTNRARQRRRRERPGYKAKKVEQKQKRYTRALATKAKKRCKACDAEIWNGDSRRMYCDACKPNNPESLYKAIRRRHLQKNYGITPEQYDELFRQQNGVCAVCKRPPGKRRLAVDHDHVTGKVRGLLCAKCNIALGYVDDDTNILQKLIRYLGL